MKVVIEDDDTLSAIQWGSLLSVRFVLNVSLLDPLWFLKYFCNSRGVCPLSQKWCICLIETILGLFSICMFGQDTWGETGTIVAKPKNIQ